jgi:hypothetical protein
MEQDGAARDDEIAARPLIFQERNDESGVEKGSSERFAKPLLYR